MNRWYCFLLPLWVLSCIGKHKTETPKVIVNPTIEHNLEIEADTLLLNLEKSKIHWVATEMRGTKRRMGIISFNNGLLLLQKGEIVGGKFTVDMESMDVTDIPMHEHIARENLLNHLKSDDFFNVVQYPTATLRLTNVQKIKNDSLKISGNLTIREVTKNIQFYGYHKRGMVRTNFKFNRLDWNIAYEGSWADKTLIDKDVELIIEIETE